MHGKKPEEFEVEDFVVNESFQNYHLGKNNQDELFWQEWIADHPEKSGIIDEAILMLDGLMFRLNAREYKQELENIRQKIETGIIVEKEQASLFQFPQWEEPRKKEKKRFQKIGYLILLITIVVSAGIYFLTNKSPKKNFEKVISQNTGSTPLELLLSDSTIVILAPNSQLEYIKQFSPKDRNVVLHGEGYFHVKRDDNRPFKVFSEGLTATVLGTEFNVKKQFGDSLVMVELISGKVRLEANNIEGSIILNPNERVVYTRKTGSMHKEIWEPENKIKTNRISHLEFEKDNFDEIAEKMNEVFGVKLVNKSNKIQWSFTGEFNDVTAIDIVENICLLKHLKYQVNGDTIVLK